MIGKNSDDIKSKGKWTNLIVDAAAECNLDAEELYDLYGTLSSEIHGKPWSGPAVQIVSSNLKTEYSCFIRNLATAFGFEVQNI